MRRSTITILPEHHEALLQDLQQDTGETTTDICAILYDRYYWLSYCRGDGALVSLHPASSESEDEDTLSREEKVYEWEEWLEVCKILASYTPEGSTLEWNDEAGYFRFFFTRKTVVFQVGEVLYRDQPSLESSLLS